MGYGYYHILKNKKTNDWSCYYTDSLKPEYFKREFDESIEDKDEISFEDWTPYMIAEVFSNLLEEENRHNMVELPDIIRRALQNTSLLETEQAEVLKNIMMEVCPLQ